MAKECLSRSNRIFMIATDRIVPNPQQPRQHFKDAELYGLARSIESNGILQPLLIRPTDNLFELISGERRLRAAGLVGLTEVPCVICNANDRESAVFALLENLQRADLHYFEEAAALKRLLTDHELTQGEAAVLLGRSQPYISNKLRLLMIPSSMREEMILHDISEREARGIVRQPNENAMRAALRAVILRKTGKTTRSREVNAKNTKENRPTAVFKNIRIFLNTFNKAVDIMRDAGIEAGTNEEETEEYYIYTVKIPKQNQKQGSA